MRTGLDESIAEQETHYRLVMTDIIVEKALKRLEEQASTYHTRGRTAYWVGVFFIAFAIICAGLQTLSEDHQRNVLAYFGLQEKDKCTSFTASVASSVAPTTCFATPEKPIQTPTERWIDLLGKFIRGFTFYGLLVLAAVRVWGFSKAMLDQAERLFERRHAVRQGKLYVHLKGGEIKTIEEMEKAFGWNLEQPNAFAGIATDAKAPWGAVFATLPELVKTLPELAKNLKEQAKKDTGSVDKDKKDSASVDKDKKTDFVTPPR